MDTSRGFNAFSYAKAPMWLFKIPMSAWAMRVCGVLARCMNNQTKTCFPSKRFISLHLLGPDPIQGIKRGLREAVRLGIVVRESRLNEDGASRSNLYSFADQGQILKICDRFSGQRSTRGGVKTDPPWGSKQTPRPIYMIERKEKELKHRRTPEKQKPSPTRSLDRGIKTQKINPDTEAAIEHIRKTYREFKGVEMRFAPRHVAISSGIVDTFRLEGAKALWSLWWKQGPWSNFANESGHSIEAWDRCIDRLVDAPEYRDYVTKFKQN